MEKLTRLLVKCLKSLIVMIFTSSGSAVQTTGVVPSKNRIVFPYFFTNLIWVAFRLNKLSIFPKSGKGIGPVRFIFPYIRNCVIHFVNLMIQLKIDYLKVVRENL